MDRVVGVVTDLFFQGRIAAAATAAGTSVRFLRSMPDVEGAEADLALVDLDAALDVDRAISVLAARGTAVVAFGPHLHVERLKAARAAGAERVVAKSRFVTILPDLLAGRASPEGAADDE